jgi:hypothetical protein
MAASRKLYEDLAYELRVFIAEYPRLMEYEKLELIRHIGSALKRDNPHFKADWFRDRVIKWP